MKINAVKPSQNPEAKTFSWIRKQITVSSGLIYITNQSRWGRERSKMWTLKTKTDFTHISIWLHWIMLQHAADMMEFSFPHGSLCLAPGCSDHILASDAIPLWCLMFMLTLSAGIGLQRSYLEVISLHFSKRKELSLWMLLACKVQLVSVF